jgi:UMF1 family MFS transporter
MKLAGMFGLLGIGLLQVLVGLQTAILFCVLLFAVALVVALRIDEGRGRGVAEAHDAGETIW